MLAFDALDYWQTVSRNRLTGLGACYHWHHKQSHQLLNQYCKKHGEKAFNKAVDTLFSLNKGH